MFGDCLPGKPGQDGDACASPALSRSRAFPPVDGFGVSCHLIEHASDELIVGAPASGEAELPEFLGRAVVMVDRFVHGVGVDLTGPVTIHRCCDLGKQSGQLLLVVGAHTFAGGSPFSFGAHDLDGTVSWPAGRG
jgi:hypothetical protein